MGEDWLLALQDEFTKPYFLQVRQVPRTNAQSLIHRYVAQGVCDERTEEQEGVPAWSDDRYDLESQLTVSIAEDIYSWSRFCPLKDVRVVIVGEYLGYLSENKADDKQVKIRTTCV